jgi:glucose/arabinose dehydrogenase
MRKRFVTMAALVAPLAFSASCGRAQTLPVAVPASAVRLPAGNALRTGQAALGAFETDAPGVRRRITLADLPAPYDTRSVDMGAHVVPRPEGAWPKVPAGFKIEEFITRLNNPRKIITAPNGDIFVAESGPNRVRVLRDSTGAGKPDVDSVFATGLLQPFGIAFYPPGPNPKYVYVANTDGVVRFPYKNGDVTASGPAEVIVDNIPSGGHLRGGGHWTRDVVFSPDARHMFVSVGSWTNDMNGGGDEQREVRRADILEFTPDGKNETIYASGVRNAVGLAIQPKTGDLWMSVNERDNLGSLLPPDYISHVTEGGFYGWPWFYLAKNQWDPRHKGEHPELANKVVTPDVLVQPHMASLCLTFYTGASFPKEYRGDIFAAEHGSWNREPRTGYNVVRVPLKNGKASGEYDDFVTGFVTPGGDVWGRPVGVTVGKEGALYVSDDASGTIWRVSPIAAQAARK